MGNGVVAHGHPKQPQLPPPRVIERFYAHVMRRTFAGSRPCLTKLEPTDAHAQRLLDRTILPETARRSERDVCVERATIENGDTLAITVSARGGTTRAVLYAVISKLQLEFGLDAEVSLEMADEDAHARYRPPKHVVAEEAVGAAQDGEPAQG